MNTVFCVTKDFWFFLCSFWSYVIGIRSVLTNWVCWVRGNFSGGPGHVYIPCLYLFSGDWRAGTILFGHSGGVDGGTVQIFLLFWLYICGYCTGETVRGVTRFSFFSSVCCLFSWRLYVCGRDLLWYIL